MAWFKRKPPKHPQEIRVPRVQFLGEQDGPAEQSLKGRLAEFFTRDRSVLKAYLARVDVGGQTSVALCLKTQFGPDRGLAEKIGAIFKTIFNAEVHLDIMFATAAQEVELSQVCQPFFVAARVKVVTGSATPLPGEIEEAKRNPNGWVYRIAGPFAPNESVPPEAIVGAWKVDVSGRIVGGFVMNEKYDPKRWPNA